MINWIQKVLETAPGGTARGEFEQQTIDQLLQTLESITFESEHSFRVIYGWNKNILPRLPMLPTNRHLPAENYYRLPCSDDRKFTGIVYLFDNGSDCFSLIGGVTRHPGFAVFQQKLPVDVVWSFERSFQEKVLTQLEKNCKSDLPYLPESREQGNLAGEFQGRLIKFLEENLMESKQTQGLIIGIMQVQKTISRELDFQRLLELVGETLIETFRFDLGELDLYNKNEDRLYHEVTWNAGSGDMSLSRNLQILIDLDEERSYFRNGTPMVLDKLQENDVILNHKLVEILGLNFAIFLPLQAGKEKVGLLKMYFGQNQLITRTRLAWYDELSNLLANSILNAKEHTRIFELATKDGLTNLHNRRYFEEQFYLELARSQRNGKSMCLLMLDVDKFKTYNDRNGHLKGDEVLVKVARLIKSSIRTVDFIARYGGEEFIVLLTNAGIGIGETVAEKIRTCIEKEKFENEEGQPGGCLTVSIGVSELMHETATLENMIMRADKALYEAKADGRNCVKVDEPTE
jgi:diguanylate cyclase (GGDEF)-like protein